MKFYTIYKTVNKDNGKTYIGKHITDNLYDGYLGSGKYLKRAIEKYGQDSFEKFILFIFNNEMDMDNKEKELVNEEYLKGDTYNLKLGGEGGWKYVSSLPKMKEVRKNNAENARSILNERIKDPLIKEFIYKKCSDRLKKLHEQNIIKIPSWNGRKHKQDSKNKISISHKGKHVGEKNSNYGNCWIHNSEKSILIKKEKIEEYLSNGWIKGR